MIEEEQQKERVSLLVENHCSNEEEAIDFDENNFFMELDCHINDAYEQIAERMVDDGLYGEIPENLTHYIDYEAIGRDLKCGGDFVVIESVEGRTALIFVWYNR